MNVKTKALIIAFSVWFLPNTSSLAEEVDGKPVMNTKLLAKAEALIKSASKVIKNEEGVITLTSPGHSYASKTQMLFFRKHGNRIEMIGTGIFVKETVDEKTDHKELVAELDRDTIIKYPEAGDFGVPMTDPSLSALDGRGLAAAAGRERARALPERDRRVVRDRGRHRAPRGPGASARPLRSSAARAAAAARRLRGRPQWPRARLGSTAPAAPPRTHSQQ